MNATALATALAATPVRGTLDDHRYHDFLGRLQARFLQNLGEDIPVFTTDAAHLFDAYLDGFNPEDRQHHNCNACRHFINHFGGLVTIDDDGDTRPAFWDTADTDPVYERPIENLVAAVKRAKVTGVFLSAEAVLGTPVTGPWQHLSVTLPPDRVFSHALYSANQVMAEKREDYKNVVRALADYPAMLVQSALVVLNSDTLYQSEKVLGQAQFLLDLHTERRRATYTARLNNLTWRAIATAPAGFCHPRSSMIGTLLDDIAAGLDHATYARRFAAKMDPLKYQRPQVAPAAGNIAQAEQIVAKLGIAAALKRRFARLDEITTRWTPTPPKTPAGSDTVFGHLKAKDAKTVPPVSIPQSTVTWTKFARTVLPHAARIELKAPSYGNYSAIVTAADPDAPPIVQWDTPEHRNPCSWYVYTGGSRSDKWGLAGGAFVAVTAIADQPSMWAGHYPHQGESAFFILQGCRDTGTPTACLFPSLLKAELHSIRATIEAHSQASLMDGAEQASACGYRISPDSACDIIVRVTDADGNTALFTIDRWD